MNPDPKHEENEVICHRNFVFLEPKLKEVVQRNRYWYRYRIPEDEQTFHILEHNLDLPVSGFFVSEDVVEGLLARKLKASAATGGAAADVNPPKLAKALFFSCPSSPPTGFRRRAFLITRPLISASGACKPKSL